MAQEVTEYDCSSVLLKNNETISDFFLVFFRIMLVFKIHQNIFSCHFLHLGVMYILMQHLCP